VTDEKVCHCVPEHSDTESDRCLVPSDAQDLGRENEQQVAKRIIFYTDGNRGGPVVPIEWILVGAFIAHSRFLFIIGFEK
jgi:hypothetical protein